MCRLYAWCLSISFSPSICLSFILSCSFSLYFRLFLCARFCHKTFCSVCQLFLLDCYIICWYTFAFSCGLAWIPCQALSTSKPKYIIFGVRAKLFRSISISFSPFVLKWNSKIIHLASQSHRPHLIQSSHPLQLCQRYD